MNLQLSAFPIPLLICTLLLLAGCKRNVINPNGEGCRKVEEIQGLQYPRVIKPAANWSTGKLVVSVQTDEDEPWQLRAYDSNISDFLILDEAPVAHTSAWSNGNWIAYHDWDDGGIYRIKPDGSLKKRISSSPMTPTLNWHPEEDILLIGNVVDIWRVDIDGNLVGDTLRLADPEIPLPLVITPLHWLEADRIYGKGPDYSIISYYSINDQKTVEVIDLEGNASLSVNSISALEDKLLVYCTREGVFLLDLVSGEVGKRLLKGCENQKAIRLSAYDTQNFYMEVSLVNRDGLQSKHVFRKNINKNSEEELEIF